MKYSKIPLSQTVVSLCQAHNIKHIVISPGSRNAPLTIGFTHNDFFECYSIVDERCAAFFALGIAQQLQCPVALVCTSGSALLNYYPAIAEAFYSQIPLVVLSADRPKHLIDIGDGQTINQKNVYGEHAIYSTTLKLDLKDDNHTIVESELPIFNTLRNTPGRYNELQLEIQAYNEEELHHALTASKLNSGPVHINIPFDEPLYDMVDNPSVNLTSLPISSKEKLLSEFDVEQILSVWQNVKRKMILVGVLQPNSIENKWIQELADDDTILVFTETTSNLHHQDLFPGIDKIIAPLDTEQFKMLQPELLITFGGLIVSKKIKAFLRNYKPKEHWHVGLLKANDTFFCLNKHIKLSPNWFLEILLPKVNKSLASDYKSIWLKIRQERRDKHKQYITSIPFSDFKVFDIILNSLPANSQLQVGNSSAVRYTQLFHLLPNIEVFCNRGTSGIDGSTSTAIGASVVSNKRTTFITGDLSFFYDSNALWNQYIPANFRIVVINNGGGGIFRILPGHKNTENFDRFFETKHNLKAMQLCDMFNFDYLSAKDEESLKCEIKSFYKDSTRPKLLEVFTPSRLNDKILLDYFHFIK